MKSGTLPPRTWSGRRADATLRDLDRFADKATCSPHGCWDWHGARHHSGYGKFSWGHSRCVIAHRWAYQVFVGPIPEGLVLDHLCRVRWCVNPEHLEPVTQAENLLRGNTTNARAARRAA